MSAFGADEERSDRSREKASIAAVLVDRRGIPLAENSVGISSFAWALPKALAGDLASLGDWAVAERGLIEGLTRRLALTDEEGNRLPLNSATIDAAFSWLVTTIGLKSEFFEAPTFTLRVFHSIKAKGAPEVDLLNSFYLDDLARAHKLVEGRQPATGLSRYLGINQLKRSPNLLEDRETLEALIAPGMIPLARWPAPGGYPLVTLQQAAVNAARSELGSADGGVVAVNGPPGTGKTTLLRDVVAACVVDRASAMAAFDDPLLAFSTTGQKISAGSNAFLHLYRIHESLRGHEVLVASSNNKAVENVSRELPALKAIGSNLRYFKSISDRLMGKENSAGAVEAGEPTWGLIAAVLGNASNRSAFQKALWWDNDTSLRLYLKAARGDSVVREIKDETGKVVRRETPTVISAEAPPSPAQAKARWTKARATFQSLKAEVVTELRALEGVRREVKQLAEARRLLAEAEAARKGERMTVADSALALQSAGQALARAKTEAEVARDLVRLAFANRPGWLSRVFGTRRFLAWKASFAPLEASRLSLEREAVLAATRYSNVRDWAAKAEEALRASENRVKKHAETVSGLDTSVTRHRTVLSSRLVDERFFEKSHDAWNLEAPWIPDHLHAKREAVFEAAIHLHRAFIDVAAQRITHNIGALMGAMQVGAFKDDAKKALLSDLWATLYLVVPVMSTTFASVGRMLGDLPPASIGWLLIDEAGQATPQSAIGAIMRAKRSIVVGDPLQIPPVVTLPKRLMAEIGKYFNVDTDRWFAPEASVQTIADAASRYQAEFRADVGVRQVGIPLLVHRRCQEPMFGISNMIAYDRQMVHSVKKTARDAIEQVLGSSAWINIDGHADSKWCPEEGDKVVELLRRLAQAGSTSPDLYVITPFRVVAQGLRDRLRAETELFKKLAISDIDEWCRNRVGTIHTFQGKEADAVIAVLGAPASSQQGARMWAAGTPNILNVMVSRAKTNLYVIGSRAAWGHVGHARDMADRVPVRSF